MLTKLYTKMYLSYLKLFCCHNIFLKRCSFVSSSFMKIEWKSIRIQKHTHFIFSFKILAISLYINIFNLMLTNKVCQKSLEILYFGKISKYLDPNLNLLNFSELVVKITYASKILENTVKTRLLDYFFTFWN